MKKIVLLRHGESAWNKENRFTGWTDVDLTEKGVAEAEKAGVTLREYGFNFDKAYTSYLKRAQKSLLDAEERILSAEYNTKLCEISLLQISGKITKYLEQ